MYSINDADVTNTDPKKRFSNRVEDYRNFRPRYPHQLIDILKSVCGLNRDYVIADVGSGTGILTELLLPHCERVYAIEPNPEMRHAAEKHLRTQPHFISVIGSAEETTLPDRSVDMIIAAQAFHWFDRSRSKIEFARILKKRGWTVLLWNSRRTDANEFHKGLERLLAASSPDYSLINHRNIDKKELADFFSPQVMTHRTLSNEQILDWDGLKGRLRSASYIPKEGKRYEEIMDRAYILFRQFQERGFVSLQYTTEIFLSQV